MAMVIVIVIFALVEKWMAQRPFHHPHRSDTFEKDQDAEFFLILFSLLLAIAGVL